MKLLFLVNYYFYFVILNLIKIHEFQNCSIYIYKNLNVNSNKTIYALCGVGNYTLESAISECNKNGYILAENIQDSSNKTILDILSSATSISNLLNETAYFLPNTASSNFQVYKYRLCAFYNNKSSSITTTFTTTISSLSSITTDTTSAKTYPIASLSNSTNSNSFIRDSTTNVIAVLNIQNTSFVSNTTSINETTTIEKTSFLSSTPSVNTTATTITTSSSTVNNTFISILTTSAISIFDTSIIDSSFINVSKLLLTEITDYAPNKLILCENTSNPFIDNLNATISSLIDFIQILKETNTTDVDIIDYWKIEALSSLKHVPDDFKNISNLLNNIINDQKYKNIDVSSRILSLRNELNNLTESFSLYKYLRTSVSDFINQSMFPKIFNGFLQVQKGATNIWNILTQLSSKLTSIYNFDNCKTLIYCLVYQKYTHCGLTIDQVYTKILTMESKFEAINQLTFIMNDQIKSIYGTFIDYRYQVFLAENYNTSISPSLNLTNQAADNLYAILIELNNPLGLIYQFELLNNSSDLNSAFQNTTIYLNSAIYTIERYQNSTINLNSSNFSVLITTVNNTNYLLKLYLEYINASNLTIISSPKMEPPALIPITNSTIGATIISNGVSKLEHVNTYSETFAGNSKSFYLQLISYKSLQSNSFFNILQDMIIQASTLNASIYSESQYFNYISSTIDTISQTDQNSSMLMSNSFIELTKYLTNFTLIFSNFSLEINTTNYFNIDVNQTILFTQKFINFTQIFLANIPSFNISSPINSYLNTITSNLMSGLNDIYNSLIFVYTTTTITTTTTTSFTSTTISYVIKWNEWSPWSNCLLFRNKLNLITNYTIYNVVNVSCDLIKNENEVASQIQNIANQQQFDQQNIQNKTTEKLNSLKTGYAIQIAFNYNFSLVAIITICVFACFFPLIDFINFLSKRKTTKTAITTKIIPDQTKPNQIKPFQKNPFQGKPVNEKFKAKAKKIHKSKKYLEIFTPRIPRI